MFGAPNSEILKTQRKSHTQKDQFQLSAELCVVMEMVSKSGAYRKPITHLIGCIHKYRVFQNGMQFSFWLFVFKLFLRFEFIY